MNPEVKIKISALDNSQGAFKSVRDNLGKVEKTASSFRSRLDDLEPTFQRMTAFGTVAFSAVALGANRAIDSATTLGESMNAVNVIFGSSANTILKFGETAAKSVGLSSAAFNQLATNTGTVLSNTGKSMDEVAQMTTDLAIRAADLASVYNTDVETAMNAIRSALIGQSEPLRNLGVVMSEAQTKAFALSTGIIEVDREMTEQEKTLARYNFIMAETTKQAGDFANTSDSLANKSRILAAQTENLSAKMGALLAPMKEMLFNAIEPLLVRISEWIEANPELARNIVIATASTAALVAVVGALGLAINIVLSPISLIIVAMAAVAAGIYIVATRFEQLPGVLRVLLFPIKMLVDSFNLLWEVIKWVGDGITWFFNRVGLATAKAQHSIIDLQGTIDKFADPLAGQSVVVEKFGGAIATVGDQASEAADKIKELREEAAGIFSSIDESEEASKRELAEAIVEQEENVSQMKKELRKLEREDDNKTNRARIRELKDAISEEKAALQSANSLKRQLRSEIDEAERRAALTAFERKVEDIQRERELRLEAQVERLLEIQREIQAEHLKNNAIANSFTAAQQTMQTSIEKTREVAEKEAERMKKAFDRAIESMSRLGLSGVTQSIMPTSSARVRRVNDAVISPKGDIVTTHPDDWLIATKNPRELGAGGSPTFNFYVQGDITDRVKTDIMRDLKRQMRLT